MAEASRTYDLAPSEIEGWVEDAKKGMENALKANPLDVRQQYEKQLQDLQSAHGEAMLELRPQKRCRPLMERDGEAWLAAPHSRDAGDVCVPFARQSFCAAKR